VQPMLATPATVLPSGADWLYEFKWDGVRALAEITAGRVVLRARSGNDITVAYPELVDPGFGLGSGIDDALLDGEIVAFQDGRPSFGLLQTRMHVRSAVKAAQLAASTPVSFIAFDILRLFGVDLTPRPLRERRDTLARLAEDHPNLVVSPVFDDGPATETASHEHGLEGVIAKRADSPYRAGRRTPEWVKVKFVRRAEFVVIGWESDVESPDELSSLVLGYYQDEQLHLAGKVGSGLNRRIAAQLRRQLLPAPFALAEAVPVSPGRSVHWVAPEIVVEVGYTEWGADGRLRHPVFAGIRTDKRADEVGRDA
jgi:bifunctional non-homologous end joining protein LigD